MNVIGKIKIGLINAKGGGGGSGAVSYPAYMQTIHSDWLDDTGTDTISVSMTAAMTTALATSPWATQAPYDPDADLTANQAIITAFTAILAGITDTTDWAALFTQAGTSVGAATAITVADIADSADVNGITEAVIVADVDAFADQIDDEITTKVLPRFRSGMRDINAVVSSAFVLGASVIEGFRDREVAKHNSAIRLSAATKNTEVDLANEQLHLDVRKANALKDLSVGEITTKTDAEYERMYLGGTEQMLKLMLQRIAWQDGNVKTTIEANRIKIVAKSEENEVDMTIDKNDALWDLEVFKYGGNLLAGIGGGAVGGASGPSTAQSAIGGAMSGAASGAMIGSVVPGVGTAVGAGVGAVLGIASAFL